MHIGSPWAEILIVLAAYLVGGIPFGWLFARAVRGTREFTFNGTLEDAIAEVRNRLP